MEMNTDTGGKMTATPKTPAAFRKAAERIFRSANPDAALAIEWTHSSRVKWHDGSSGFSGVATATAPGFKTKTIVASASRDGITVR